MLSRCQWLTNNQIISIVKEWDRQTDRYERLIIVSAFFGATKACVYTKKNVLMRNILSLLLSSHVRGAKWVGVHGILSDELKNYIFNKKSRSKSEQPRVSVHNIHGDHQRDNYSHKIIQNKKEICAGWLLSNCLFYHTSYKKKEFLSFLFFFFSFTFFFRLYIVSFLIYKWNFITRLLIRNR